MEELLEMITWSQLGIHNKPVGLLHVDGYYDPLLALFDKGVEEGFIKPPARYIVLSASLPRQLLDTMEVSISVYPHLPKPSSFFDLFWSFFIYWQTSLLGIVAYYR